MALHPSTKNRLTPFVARFSLALPPVWRVTRKSIETLLNKNRVDKPLLIEIFDTSRAR